jgi:hypothetical protein
MTEARTMLCPLPLLILIRPEDAECGSKNCLQQGVLHLLYDCQGLTKLRQTSRLGLASQKPVFHMRADSVVPTAVVVHPSPPGFANPPNSSNLSNIGYVPPVQN